MFFTRFVLLIALALPTAALAQAQDFATRQPLTRDVLLGPVLGRVAPHSLQIESGEDPIIICYGLVDDASKQPILLSAGPLHETRSKLYLRDSINLKLDVKRTSVALYSLAVTFAGDGLIKALSNPKISLEQLENAFGSAAVNVDGKPATLFFLTGKISTLQGLANQARATRNNQ